MEVKKNEPKINLEETVQMRAPVLPEGGADVAAKQRYVAALEKQLKRMVLAQRLLFGALLGGSVLSIYIVGNHPNPAQSAVAAPTLPTAASIPTASLPTITPAPAATSSSDVEDAAVIDMDAPNEAGIDAGKLPNPAPTFQVSKSPVKKLPGKKPGAGDIIRDIAFE